MYARNPTSPTALERQYQYQGRPVGSGLAIDTRDVQEIYGSVSPRDRRSPQPPAQRQPLAAAAYRATPAVSRPQGARSGHAELTPVTAWGHITVGGGGQGAGAHARPPSHTERDSRLQRGLGAEGAASPPPNAGRGDVFMTPPTAHRMSTTTALAGGPPADDGTPRMRVRNNTTTGTPASQRYSQAEFDTYDGRSVAAASGLDSQFSRPNYDDSSMYAHSPGRDPYQAAMHALGRGRPSTSSAAGQRTASGAHANLLSPETNGLAAFGAPARGHARGSSVASPASRARAIEDAHNALTGGSGSARAGRGLPAAQTTDERHTRRLQAAHSWLAPGVAASTRDTQSDTYSWGVQGAGRSRAGSFAVAGGGRQAAVAEPRGNGLSVENGRHPHRASYTGSGHGSHAPSGGGSAQQRGAGASFVGGASARKARHQSLQQKSGKTPIRSNWFHREEMLNDSDLKDQEFLSSDEEDFGDEERGYGGDLVAQQKLIQKQQRTIFDLNMQCKMMQNSIGAANKEPYEALLHDFGRTCASNRRANREIEQLRSELKQVREQCAALEDVSANPPPCRLVHAMNADERIQVARLEAALDEARRELETETMLAKQRIRHLEDRDAQIRDLREQLAREQLNSERQRQRVEGAASPTRPQPLQNQRSGSPKYAAANEPLSPRGRTGTATTASETATVRAASEASAGADLAKDGLEAALFASERKREQTEDELRRVRGELQRTNEDLRRSEKKVRDYEEQRRVLQLEMRRMQDSHLALGGRAAQVEISKLTAENEALKDEAESLQRQLDDAREEAHTSTEAALATLSALKLDGDEEAPGSAAQRAEIARLQLECRDFEQQSRIHETNVHRLTEELERNREQMHRLCHDYLRPRLRELTVGAAQAESVYEHVRRWSQLKVVVPAEDDATPTRHAPGHSAGQGRGLTPLASASLAGRFDLQLAANAGGRTSR